jgi:hypothetical protein
MQAPQIRPCLFVLRTEVARNEYNTIALALIQADRLTMHTHRVLSSYATQVDAIAIAIEEGRPLRASWFTQMDRARGKLKLHELEKPVISSPPNKFALCGFASRSRVKQDTGGHIRGAARKVVALCDG